MDFSRHEELQLLALLVAVGAMIFAVGRLRVPYAILLVLGGLALGLLESFGAIVFGSQWSTTVGFALMILVLVVRPSGLVGRKGFE